jgi:hypothetical protein
VALLIKDTLVPLASQINIPEHLNSHELIGVSIKKGNENISLFTWYIPPGKKQVDKDMMSFIENQGNFILMGDMNARVSSFGPTNELGRSLENCMQSFRGQIINKVNNPTFVHLKNLILSTTLL